MHTATRINRLAELLMLALTLLSLFLLNLS